jgi:hypothetical protein
MEIVKHASRKWKTSCTNPECRAEFKYTKLDTYKVESRTPASVVISSSVKMDMVKCPECGKEIQVFFKNECI